MSGRKILPRPKTLIFCKRLGFTNNVTSAYNKKDGYLLMENKTIKHAVASKRNIFDENDPIASDFLACIDDLLEAEDVQMLTSFHQHCNTSRLQHCLSVSYYSYLIAAKIGADPRKAARAGLLHDLFLYDWRTAKMPENHAFYHPKAALENAKKITELSKREEDAILKHMWPLCKGMPAYKESVAVTIADKYAASIEVVTQWSLLFLRKLHLVRS